MRHSRLLYAMLALAGTIPAAHRADATPLTCLSCGQEIPHGIGSRCLVCQRGGLYAPIEPEPSTPPPSWPDTAAPVVAPVARRIRPIDIACPTCHALARQGCDRRTMGNKRFHYDRVVAARGGR